MRAVADLRKEKNFFLKNATGFTKCSSLRKNPAKIKNTGTCHKYVNKSFVLSKEHWGQRNPICPITIAIIETPLAISMEISRIQTILTNSIHYLYTFQRQTYQTNCKLFPVRFLTSLLNLRYSSFQSSIILMQVHRYLLLYTKSH